MWHGIVLDVGFAGWQLSNLALTKRRLYTLAHAQFLLLCNLQLAIAVFYVGPALGYQYYFFPFISVVFLVTPRRLAALYPISLLSLGLYLYFELVARQEDAVVSFSPRLTDLVRLVIIVSTCITLALIAFLFDADTREAEHKLAAEHDRSERLLLNILPRTISERLKGGQQAIADGFANVSVLFADIVGFTVLSAKLPPQELVRVLNEVFSRFDELAEKHRLEKIKTIGDAYMVAAGLPEPRPDHAEAVALMALEMRAALDGLNRKHGYELEVRIGINSGPVVAGVIGKKKFIYDLWGDTVNTASRMESHGVKDAIHVTQATAELLKEKFDLESRGPIEVKGKGEMETFLVLGEKP
ncbi:MAG: adenylate/guanylate cyclase domain-containing protein [Polyangiaceae bacterium]|nr:adenylate/guanylate cyclase domain-containing protein [Polyangiaceae bacterium]